MDARTVTSPSHLAFQAELRAHLQADLIPHLPGWEKARRVPRSAWRDLGGRGYLCPRVSPAHGGLGGDFGHAAILGRELGRTGWTLGFSRHSDIIVPYLSTHGTPAQQQRWLPGCVTGELITALAMSEPETGADLHAIATTATRDGDHYVLDGHKTFISNGTSCDLVLVLCRTDPLSFGPEGLSLLVVEDGTPGFIKARQLDTMGLHAQDTAEFFFQECRVPVGNRLGEEHRALQYLQARQQEERLLLALESQGLAERVLELALACARQRKGSRPPIGSFQHNQFKLAEMATEVELGRALVEELTRAHQAGQEVLSRATMAKWWTAEMVNRLAGHAVQLHGGHGFVEEYEIARLYRDVRMRTIAGGTTELMKQAVAGALGL